MPDDKKVAGRMGDVSGRLGDVSGRLGDVSGRLGDVSGRLGDVSGRLGDVSGSAGLDEVEDALFLDREADRLKYTEARIRRLETQVLLIVRWTNAQFLTHGAAGEIKALQKELDDQVERLDTRIAEVDTRVRKLEPPPA